MQDDFGEFLQASPATFSANAAPAFGGAPRKAPPKDLNSKIMESFDLSGSSQKASFRFQQPAKQTSKRPQNMVYKQSSSSADWKSLDLKTSEFTAPTRHHQRSSAEQSQNYNKPAHPMNQQPSFQQQVPHNFQHAYGRPQMLGYMPQAVNNPQVNFQGKIVQPMQNNTTFNQSQGMFMPNNHQHHNFQHQVPLHPQHQARFMAPSNTRFQGNSAGSSFPGAMQPHLGFGSQVFGQGSRPTVTPIMPSPNNMPTLSNQDRAKSPESRRSDFSLPSWMTKPNEIPQLYKDVLKLCATPNSFADTSRLYPIFMSSHLPKDILGHIWSAANQSTPGQLTFSEVYIALALIALAQKGEMNLTVNYVTKLKTPPIPMLQLPATSSTVLLPTQQSSLGNFPDLKKQSMENVPQIPKSTHSTIDDFTEFQSVPPITAPSSNELSFSIAPRPAENDFQDFQSFDPTDDVSVNSSQDVAPTAVVTYPDRNLINSPKSQFADDSSVTTVRPKPLLGSIDFSKFKSDSMKALHTAAKTLNLSSHSASTPTLSSNHHKDNDFTEFKMNTSSSGNDILASKIEGDDFNDFSSAPACALDDSFNDFTSAPPIIGSVTGTSLGKPRKKFDLSALDYSSTTKNDFTHYKSSFTQPTSLPSLNGSTIIGNMENEKQQDLLFSDAILTDKYSALRDLVPPVVAAEPEITNSEIEFADFQSIPSLTQTSEVPQVLSDSEKLKPSSPSFPSFFGKQVTYKEDSQSVSSLELPSLSKTISNLSIGSSSPSTKLEDSEKNDPGFGDFANFESAQTNIPAMPSALNFNRTNVLAPPNVNGFQGQTQKAQDDGLYSLDEPISPPAAKKFPVKGTPMSAPKVKRTIVPRRISEADSDFGDFSSGPPPMDDVSDQHNTEEFDMYQGGNSSLVDFDAFGHFEEAKQETMKKKAEFSQKRSKKDATAFSEFVELSIGNLKPSHEVNGALKEESDHFEPAEEGWSAFDDGRVTVDELNNTDSSVHVSSSENQLTVELNIGGDSDSLSGTTWKLESTISESEFENVDQGERSKWDEEGEELKARMEGTLAANSTELYADHWGRCLSTCKDIIVSTGDIFAALNSPSVCHEIVNSKRGKEFISSTSEVYGVARRIRKGMESVGLLDEELAQTLKEIEIAWNNLLGFCPYTPSVHKTPEHCSVPPNVSNSSYHFSACSLCLLSTNESTPVGLEYGGKSYHAPCANLWLNQIAPILPRLELPTAS